MSDTKRCTKCGITKPTTEFYPKGVTRFQSHCKSCKRIAASNFPTEARRRKLLWKEYKLSTEAYNALLKSQGGKCGVCGCISGGGKHKGHLHVDHCHATGRIRGLLCYQCNTALGKLGDDLAGVLRFVSYLRRANPEASVLTICDGIRSEIDACAAHHKLPYNDAGADEMRNLLADLQGRLDNWAARLA